MSARRELSGKLKHGQDRLVPSVQPFLELDLEKIKNDLHLIKEGQERGEKNLPPSPSDVFDDVEHRIITTIETELKRQQQSFSDQLNAYHQCITSLDLENEAINIGGAAQRASSEFVVKVNEGKATLFTLWRNVCMIENQWNDFRKKHGLQYPADYPLSRLWNFAIIILILAVESILNGSFLARGLETGYIGGVVQAFVIAAINVFFGVFLGDSIIRHLFHRNYILRTIAIVELPISCGFAVFFNLMVGHYRDALGGSDPMHASEIALNTFTAHPFALAALQSWMLFAMGLFFWMVAAIDGFKMDDPYPGYGKINRKHEEITQDYTNEKTNIIDDLSRTRDQALDYIRDARRSLAEGSATLSSVLGCRSRLIHLFEAHQTYLSRAANDLLSVYRNANMRSRTTPAPLHFNSCYSLSKPPPPASLPYVINETLLDTHISESDEALKKAISQVNAQFEKAAGEFRQIGEFASGGHHAA